MERRNSSLLAPIERRLLLWLAARLPRAITPDMLTGLGLAAAAVTALAYWAASQYPAFLWLASAGLIANWFGDSLDGTLARWRRIERPRYGFFFDHAVDLVEQALLAIGLAASGYIDGWLVAAGLASFFMTSVLGWLCACVDQVLDIAAGGIGLTEIRIAIIFWNAAVYFLPPVPFSLLGSQATYTNVLAAVWLTGNTVMFFAIMIRTLRRLAVEDPPP